MIYRIIVLHNRSDRTRSKCKEKRTTDHEAYTHYSLGHVGAADVAIADGGDSCNGEVYCSDVFFINCSVL